VIEKFSVLSEKQHFSFKSTNEIWVITRCTKEPCGKSLAAIDRGETGPAQFSMRWRKVTIEKAEVENVNWSLYITICTGFGVMFLALMYFEWRTIFKCIGRCKDKICGKSSQR